MHGKRHSVETPFITHIAICAVLGMVAGTSQAGIACTNVIEDFESYSVADGTYLDPTTIGGSGWARNDIGQGPDWEVTCCSPGIATPDDTFDGSSNHLRLRRSNSSGAAESVLNTDLNLTPMLEGTVSFEVNPSSTGGTALWAGLYDSVTGFYKVQLQFRELGPNSGDFIVWGQTQGQPLAASANLDGFPAAFDRWFRVTIDTFTNGEFNVSIDDIGPTTPASASAGDPARGNILTFVGNDGNGGSNTISAVNKVRLGMGSGNGGSNDVQPTMLDNFIQCVVVEQPTGEISGTEVIAAKKLVYAAEDGSVYQPQFTDGDAIKTDTWTDLGPVVTGNGGTNYVFESLQGKTNRIFRVIEIVPAPPVPVIEGFEYGSVNDEDFIDPTTLSTNWTRDGVGDVDWVVTCCNSTFLSAEETFDGSQRLMSLDRANDFLPDRTDENTDFDLATVIGGPLTNHTVSIEMNASGAGGGNGSLPNVYGGFHFSLFDSVTTQDAFRVVFFEITNNSGDFQVYDSGNNLLATGTALDGHPASFNRWYRVTMTIHGNGTFDVFADDIGPTSSASGTPDPARGNVLTLQGVPLPSGMTSVNTLRLLPGSTNGGSVNYRPTTIDNIAGGSAVTATGVPTGPIDCVEAKEITYPTVGGKQYQAQYSDDAGANWNDLGNQSTGTGGSDSAFDACVPGRTYRVLDLQP